MANFCSNCGTKVESSWNVCPICGHAMKGGYSPQVGSQQYSQPVSQKYPQTIQQPSSQRYKPSGGNNNGIMALIFGIIGCCCCGVIFGPLAIIFGSKGKNEDDDPSLANIGFILGILGLVCGILLVIWLLLLLLI